MVERHRSIFRSFWFARPVSRARQLSWFDRLRIVWFRLVAEEHKIVILHDHEGLPTGVPLGEHFISARARKREGALLALPEFDEVRSFQVTIGMGFQAQTELLFIRY